MLGFSKFYDPRRQAGAFLAAAVWGGHICIWLGRARIPDDIVYD